MDYKIITLKDKDYPILLKEIPDPPDKLYVLGELKEEDKISLSVVGSRKYTPYGERVTREIVVPLAEAGLTIVSGLALGIDSLAHKAALTAKARTVAILGSGIDQIYPVQNTKLAKEILAKGGAIISEFPIGTPAFPYNFPKRNRIIAGMTLATLVIEASVDSGSLITARQALEYNRDVFAVPGSIYNQNSFGPNNLIKMGAKTVCSAQDILTELALEVKTKKLSARQILPDTKEERIILQWLNNGPIHIDKIVKVTGLDIKTANSTLIMMEMKGKVRNLGNNTYTINV